MASTNTGRLIVFEGPENTGKSTLAQQLHTALIESEIPNECLSFPGKEIGSLGALVYAVEHDRSRTGISTLTETARQALHLAAHVDVIERRIKPLIADGTWIVLDRFWWSMWAHGVADGLSPELLDTLVSVERSIWGALQPAVIFCTLRPQPFNETLTDEWLLLHDAYAQLLQRERGRSNIDILPVQLPVADQVKRCLAIVNRWRGV